MNNSFAFTGSLSAITDNDKIKGFELKKFESGWCTRNAKVNVVSGNNRFMITSQGGIFIEGDKPKPGYKFFGFGAPTEDEGGNKTKGEMFEIPFAERTKKEWIDKVAAYTHYVIDTEEYGRRDKIKKVIDGLKDGTVDSALMDELGIRDLADATAKLKESEAKHKVFLHEWDFSKALYELTKSAGKELYYVTGDVDIQYNMDKSEAYRSYKVRRVLRAKEEEPKANVNLDFHFTKDAVDKSDWDETKTAKVNGYIRYRFNDKKRDIKGTFATEVSFKIDGSKDEKMALGLIKKLEKDFDDERPVHRIDLKLDAIDGAQKEELKYEDLTDEQKEDIECGLATLEDFQREAGSVYGERIRDYIFNSIIHKTEGVQPTELTLDDLLPPHVKSTDDDIFSDEGLDDILG